MVLMAVKKKPATKKTTAKTKSRSEESRVAPTKKGINKIVQGRVKKGEVATPGGAGKKIIGHTANQVRKVRKHGPGRRQYEQMKKELGFDTNKGAEINILGQWKKLGN
jgi:hypothetical protein